MVICFYKKQIIRKMMKRREMTNVSVNVYLCSWKNKFLRNFVCFFGTNTVQFINEISDNIINKIKLRKNSNKTGFVSVNIYNDNTDT